jgi:C4-dicarboxylate transporter DctM subunit
VPIFFPVVLSYGLDPIVFGLIVVLTCEIGFLTPPVGANLFVAMRISGSSLEAISLRVFPFVLSFILLILILIAFPPIGLIGV